MSEQDAIDQITDVVRAISIVIAKRGIVAVDIADLKQAFEPQEQDKDVLRGFVGHGEASGEGRATKAAELALLALKKHIAQE